VLIVTGLTALLAIPSALANGASEFFSRLPGVGMDFLSLMVTVWNNFSLPIGGLLTALFVGYVWKLSGIMEELKANDAWFPYPRVWGFLIRYICPAAIILIIVVTIHAMTR
jgi:neurotransmitter:Na+ symporter, NSS family